MSEEITEVMSRCYLVIGIKKLAFRIQSSHVLGLVSVKRTHLNLMRQHSVGVPLEEGLVDGHVQGGNDLLGVAHQLTVQIFIELLNVAAVDVQEWRFLTVELKGEKHFV
jgi:hypothetical protein